MIAAGAAGEGRSAAAAASFPVTAQRPLAGPSVAVLCAPRRGPAVSSAIALALARACGRPSAFATAVGATAAPGASLTPASLRAAARLRRDGHVARARGRLVWLADRRGDAATPDDPAVDVDVAGATAALSVELRRAAASAGAAAALAIPFVRCDGLDRVLAWHDGIVVVREPGTAVVLTDLVLASLARLGRPVVAVEAPRRLAAAAATTGSHTPAFAVAAVAQLGFGGER